MRKQNIVEAIARCGGNRYVENKIVAAAVYNYWDERGKKVLVTVSEVAPYEIRSTLIGGIP
jgi:hypothetical protein